jgi:hypothetical protein
MVFLSLLFVNVYSARANVAPRCGLLESLSPLPLHLSLLLLLPLFLPLPLSRQIAQQ